jgi:hypothetical protein
MLRSFAESINNVLNRTLFQALPQSLPGYDRSAWSLLPLSNIVRYRKR